jgi:hypothetical protein
MHARYVEPGKNIADLLLSSSADTERLLCALRAVLAGDGCTSTR